MSESIVRKVQPFTIGTRLSIPAVPKCADFPAGYLPARGLDNCTLQHNLNHDSVSLYLSRSHLRASGPRLRTPLARQVVSARRRQETMQAAEDHLNQNTVPPSAVSRSIKKITISGNGDDTGGDKAEEEEEEEEEEGPPISVCPSENNNNNNNNNITAGSHPRLPRVVGVSCENKASSHFQVLLRKDGDDKRPPPGGQTKVIPSREKSVQQIPVAGGRSPKKELQKRESPAHTPNDGSVSVTAQLDCFTQRTSLFTKEILQAEAWIKGKLQDLKDGCNIQRCPLQDWEEASQTLLRDLKHFENTLIQLNQMGEQLICKLNPTSDLVRKQLGQLRDQWHVLKQTAANQSRALGGAKNLQEFNRKVDKLEAWIKEKQEEEQSLVKVLGENADKMQLTRRILDLKQDEQLYRNLHEEINHLALKLEKQGKTDGKNIASRRKNINKMWLKVQSHLKNYHENLQLALEVSSFYQQADNTLFAIGNTAKGLPASKDQETCGDREIRDIASQIMMLDVTVSQLSNLHPALAAGVTQKQSEVKDCWALLQKTVRSDRAALQAAGSAFPREDADLPTPAGEAQCTVGMEPPRIMGKEVKEEQNRLKGCVITREGGSCRRTAGDHSQEQKSGSHGGALPLGDSPAPLVDDVTVRHQSEGERKRRAEPKLATALQGHPQLHIQLQRFTVSADKTLSWLKKNVAMATQACSVVGYEGLEAAKRCQDALEEEILSNRARIEVVKKEGRGLVRAQHPGSAKIEEFLGQLEVLWEELRRKHQKNALFLQASEELGFRVVKVLQALGSLQAWLESVELSLRECSLAGDPETVSAAERESRLLLREVAARGLELHALRQEVEKLRGQCPPHARSLPARMEEVERKYHRVQSALTQQSSELQDTRMLTEFLERVELEESQELTRGHYSLGQPFHSDITSTPTLLGLQSGGGGDPLMESMGDPVEELREAVEMLNDTVRERGRAQSHEQAIQELLCKHASLTVHVEECLCCCKELSMDILERETDMATKCELDHCGLEGLQEQQDQLEVDCEVIREQVEEMKAQASRLEELCPDKLRILRVKIQATLQAWTELGESLMENRRRLQEFVQLQDFFRSYLAMILWTEDTRSRIFSDLTLHHGKDGEEPLATELDFQIEQKFEEFDELSTTGSNLLHAEHHLNKMVRERMEELRSMLGWILVHWRAQKQQWLLKRKREEPSQDNIYSEATVCLPLTEGLVPMPEDHDSQRSPAASTCEDGQKSATDTQTLATPEKRSEDGYEVMKSIGPQGGEVASSESPKPPILLLKEPSSPTRGGTVNLILSFGNSGDGQDQLLEPPPKMEEAAGETSEPIHRDQSLSLLSVHMGLDGVFQRDVENQEQSTTTGGQYNTTSGKPELLAMEGTLERKQKLQLGGKKASSRAWNPYHAVLYRHTLCFYQDRKDTLRSSVCGLPLNLIGAECSPAPEYTKKPNCFCLRLRDGSEYLLNASSRFLMKKWILKIQANTGLSECSPSASNVPVIQDLNISSSSCRNQSPHCSCQGPAKCRCSSPHDVTSTFPRRKSTSTAQAKEIVVLTRDYNYMSQSLSKSLDEPDHISSSKTGGGDDDFLRWTPTQRLSGVYRDSRSFSPQSSEFCGPDWPGNKRRSHSFTSATYQKLKPVKAPPGGREQEGSSNYSVTLVIGDKSSNMTWQQDAYQDSALRSYASLPRPRNKSVFKKFFGRKDGHI
ncbi:spectrin beta chain, non-erythrocytic 2 [Lampris incognitus]|uniref:spectrin beta chain, non-erythrocytic 2 n=1 Tax=Lampris incognitus TaxID=2546036 RepID=UPI0024B591FB|nr:spectrin beta chain, non-erythrocytic 2 [Lampris incognitus]